MWASRATLVLAVASSAALFAPLTACGGGAPAARAPAASSSSARPWGGFRDAELARYHSQRLGVSFPLPDRAAWAVSDRDDLNGGWLVAKHVASSTTVRARRWDAGLRVTRLDCEARAREIGELPTAAEVDRRFETLSDDTVSQPRGWDARHWVATETAPDGRLVGHVYLFSARKRSCLIVHATTEAASELAYTELADRLELLSSRVIGGVMAEAEGSPLTLPAPRLP